MPSLNMPHSPEYSAEWRPIYFSPVPGSGERLVVAIAIRGIDGKVLVEPILDLKRLKCMFGSAGTKINSKVDMLTRHARTSFTKRVKLDSWSVPLSGFVLGDSREALDNDIEGIFQQAIMMSTGLGSQLVCEQQEVKKSNEVANHKWVTSIKNLVSKKRPELSGLFNREIVLLNGKSKEKVGFLCTQYGAEFGRINLTYRSHLQSRRMAQAKLWQLDQLRGDYNIDAPERVELIIGHKRISSLSPDEIEILNEDIGELKLEARSHDIGLFSSDSTANVVNHIFERVSYSSREELLEG